MSKKLILFLIPYSLSLFPLLCNAQYTDLLNFNGTNGFTPYGSLTLVDGKLYGMTYYGGIYNDGNIFSVDTNGGGYKDLFDFSGTNGVNPNGNLTLCGSRLYGMTRFGGIQGVGNIFSIDTNGNGFKDLYDFYGTNTYPNGSLTIYDSIMYGMTPGGGRTVKAVFFPLIQVAWDIKICLISMFQMVEAQWVT